MSAKDIPVAMRPEEERAWLHVAKTQFEKAVELAPNTWEVIREMGREIIRGGEEEIILSRCPDSALAEAIRELQREGYDPEEE